MLTVLQAKKSVNYAESDEEDDDVFQPISNNARKGRALKRRRVAVEDSDDEFGLDEATQQAMMDEDGMSTVARYSRVEDELRLTCYRHGRFYCP